MKYMPGEWFVSNTNSSLITSNNGEQHNWQMANVCQVYGMNDEQRQATAKLISAAPDMLKALSDFCEDFEAFKKGEHTSMSITEQIYNTAKYAIEKATK